MLIRPYKRGDVEGVLHSWETASSIGHPFLSEDFLEYERQSIITKYLVSGDVWVALNDSNVIGFMILHSNEVGALFVNPALHGKGVGFALMNKASQLYDELRVEVFEQNAIGNKFYKRYGFLPVSDYWHEQAKMKMLCLVYKKEK